MASVSSISRDDASTSTGSSSNSVVDKKITLLRRPSSSTGQPRSTPSTDSATGSISSLNSNSRLTRAQSEGAKSRKRAPTPPPPHPPLDDSIDGDTGSDDNSSSRRTGSDSIVALSSTSSPYRPPSPSMDSSSQNSSPVGTPRSSSPALSSHPLPPSVAQSSSSQHPPTSSTSHVQIEGDKASQDTSTASPTSSTTENGKLDEALLIALANPRDRVLLLKAEMEMEKFVADPDSSRLPLSPPHFAPGLNSYQRLLIHRLADTFGITRDAEKIVRPPGAPIVIGAPTHVVVLVKGTATKAPTTKLVSYVVETPAPPTTTLSTALASSSNASSSPAPSLIPSPSSSSTNLSIPSSAQASSAPPPSAPPTPQIFKILPRAQTASSAATGSSHAPSSASSSTGADDDSGSARGSVRSRKEMTLEEREQAYKEARERIFKETEKDKGDASSATGDVLASGRSEYGRTREATIVAGAGSAITRPSSAGSSYSRSSAAHSLAGAKPSPSIVSFESVETSSTSSSSIHAGFQGPSGMVFYAPPAAPSSQPSPGMRMVPSPMIGRSAPPPPAVLRPSAPSFDPISGGWVPYHPGYGGAPVSADYGPTPSEAYGYPGPPPVEHFHQPEGAWGHPARAHPGTSHSAPPPPHPSHLNRQGGGYPYVQPPIQVTAPYPTPSHIAPSGHSPTQQFNAHPPYPAPIPRQQYSSHPAPPSSVGSYSSPRQPIPSPSLSTSSGGSFASMDRAGAAGYLMRFPDGQVAGRSASGSSGGDLPAGSRSQSSIGSSSAASVSSASTSRNASVTSLRERDHGTSVGSASVGTPQKRQSHSASHSFSSTTSGSVGGRSDASSSVRRSTSTETSASAGGSVSGASKAGSSGASISEKDRISREREATIGSTTAGVVARDEELKGEEEDKTSDIAAEKRKEDPSTPIVEPKKLLSLHPSLPVKPGWLTSLPPSDRSASASLSSTRKSSFGSATDTRDANGRRSFSSASAPVSHAHTPPIQPPYPTAPLGGGPYHDPQVQLGAEPFGQQLAYGGRQQAFYPSNATPPAGPSVPWQQPVAPVADPYYGQYQQQQHPGYYPVPAYDGMYAGGAYHHPHHHHHAVPVHGDMSAMMDPIMMGPELRRPPPRSTMLFNPNDPSPSSNGSGGGKRAGGPGSNGKTPAGQGVARAPHPPLAGNSVKTGGGD